MSRNTIFNLHHILNLEKMLALTPPPAINFSTVKPAPDHWLSELEDLCCEHNKTLRYPFKKHLDREPPLASYEAQEELRSQLKIIYHRLTGNLDGQLGKLLPGEHASILSKITEDIAACTPGFHNRVNAVITSMQLPSSLPQLLYKTRQSLVESTAAALTEEVHAANRVTRIANGCGLGIKTNLAEDPYVGALSESDITAALKHKFESEYTPFYIPILLCDELRGVLGNFGYVGQRDGTSEENKSYDVGDAKAFATMIESCLDILQKERRTEGWYAKYFMTEDIYDEEKDEYKTYIRDVKWSDINRLFLDTLEREKYYNEKPEPEKLWEHAYYRSLEETLEETKRFFLPATTCNSQKELIQQLKKMRSICPSIYNEIIKNTEMMRQISDQYIIKIRELLMQAQKKEDYSEILSELKQLKLASPQIYQELIKRGEITRLTTKVISSLAPTTLFSRIKKIMKSPSLVLISQVFQLLMDTGPTELKNHIKKLEPTLTKRKYDATVDNFNAAISIAKTIYQHYGNFNNESLKILLKGFLKNYAPEIIWFSTEECILLKALKQLPQNTWMSFVETAGLSCSNAVRNAIRFIAEQNIDLSKLSDFLNVYDSIEKLGDNYARNFSIAIINYAEDNVRLSDPEILIMLSHINNKNNSNELSGKIKHGLQISTKEAWVKFLEKNTVHNINIFLDLAKEKESTSLRLALAEVLKRESTTTLIPIANDFFSENITARRNLFLKILSVAHTAEDGESELCEALRVSFEHKKTIFYNLLPFPSYRYDLNCCIQLLKFVATVPESTQLRLTLLKSMEKEKDWCLPLSCFGRNHSLYLGLFSTLTDLLCDELNAGDPEKIVSKILMGGFEKEYDPINGDIFGKKWLRCYEIEIWLPILISKLSAVSLLNLLNDVDKEMRARIYVVANEIRISDDQSLAIFLIAKLSAYLDENGVNPSGSVRFFSTPLLSDTKLKLDNAKKLIAEIANCSDHDLKSKIEASQSINKGIDTKRKLLVGKSTYEKCLDECHKIVLLFETNVRTSNDSADSAPQRSPGF